MPGRETPLINNSIYHVFNKTIDSRVIFDGHYLNYHFLELLAYYRSIRSNMSFSSFQRIAKSDIKKTVEKNLRYRKYFQVEILAYCLMPTHFHLLLKQRKANGASRFISNAINSFTRYYNTFNRRKGPLFLPRFQAVEIHQQGQLLHVSRYIHLNPYSSGLVTTVQDLLSYPWSSLKEYMQSHHRSDCLVDNFHILTYFNNDIQRYKEYVINNAEYQKKLEAVKYR